MIKLFAGLIASLAVSLTLATLASAQVADVSPDYPGLKNPGDVTAGMISVAEFHLQTGLRQYYKLHGAWPASWREVTNQGLFHTTIVGYAGQPVDPDDGKLDFRGDVTYKFVAELGQAAIAVLDASGIPRCITLNAGEGPMTYRELFARSDRDHNTTWFSDNLHSPGKMRLYAIAGTINNCLLLHKLVRGDYPKTWEDFIDSGLSPFTKGMMPLIPTAAGTFADNGLPNGFYYRYIPAAGGKPANGRLYILDSKGNPESRFFSY